MCILHSIAAVVAVGLGWGLEYDLASQHKDIDDFDASISTKIVHNSGWDARLEECCLSISEEGSYRADFYRNGELLQSRELLVDSESASSLNFNNVELRGGLGGMIGGDLTSLAYGYSANDYELVISKDDDSSSQEVRVEI